MWRTVLMASRIALAALCITPLILWSPQAQVPTDPGSPGSYTPAHITITTTNPSTGSQLATDIYYPSSGGNVDPSGAPYPTLVFARGFMTQAKYYVGNGQHLASWGYIVAIPDFPDEDLEVRASDVQYTFSYLEAQNADAASPFFHKIDPDRFGLTGHSLGGATTMMVAARDERVKTAVGLDPVNPPASLGVGTWDYQTEAPSITVPFGVLGAPSQTCNSSANYNTVFPALGSTHKAKYVVASASHCDFMDTDNSLQRSMCYLVCGGQFSQERVTLVERYTTAWFNYYLLRETDYYTYVYGGMADEDIQAGRITREVQTAPRQVVALGRAGVVELNWTLYDHPIIAGYNIYRSQQSGNYPSAPYTQVGRVSAYTDTAVVPGLRYFYVLRSRDADGNQHQPSNEVSAVPEGAPTYLIYLPAILKDDTTD